MNIEVKDVVPEDNFVPVKLELIFNSKQELTDFRDLVRTTPLDLSWVSDLERRLTNKLTQIEKL
jgi:hypothetical protein